MPPRLVLDGVLRPRWTARYLCAGGLPRMENWAAYARPHASVACPLKSSLIAFVKLADWCLRARRVHGSLRGRTWWTAACWRQMVGSIEVVLAVADGTAFSGTA